MRLQPTPTPPLTASAAFERPRDRQQWRPHVETMLLGKASHIDHR
jgi:hypothetical protein